MTSPVTVTDNEHFTLIAMDDGKANALGFDMLSGLDAALDQAESAGKVTVITGRPGKFCAGFDLTVMAAGGPDQLRLLRSGAELALRVVKFPLPVVLAVSGHSLAMGALLCLAADYRVGIAGGFKLGLNEVAIGMTMPWFGIELARDRLSNEQFNKAVSLAMLADPTTAVSMGYLDEAVEPEALMPRIEALCGDLAKLDMNAHARTKLRVRAGFLGSIDEAFKKDFTAGPDSLQPTG